MRFLTLQAGLEQIVELRQRLEGGGASWHHRRVLPRALTIAGSDSGGGAGIQADLKTFTVLRVYGMSAITALTAQNTQGVNAIEPVAASFVRAQIDAVVSDIGVDATKTGMLANAAIIQAVAAAVREHRLTTLVVDPVMVAQSGAKLLADEARRALLEQLIPLATLVTPNLLEAAALTGEDVDSLAGMQRAARILVERGAAACLVKGGHLQGGDAVDVYDDGREVRQLRSPRFETPHTHGTGCQLSAAITASLACGHSLWDAVQIGKRFITCAIQHSLAIGHGHGPANPLAWLDEDKEMSLSSQGSRKGRKDS